MTNKPRTREECIAEAGAALAQALAEQDEMTPRQAAEAAHRPGGPSVAELEALIRARRGLSPEGKVPPVWSGRTSEEPAVRSASGESAWPQTASPAAAPAYATVACVQAAQLVIGRKYAVRETSARDYDIVRQVPLVKAELVGPVRAGKAKIRWLEGERAELEEWVPTRHLVARWGQRQRFLRDEERLHALRRASVEVDPVVEEAISAVMEASGEGGGFARIWEAAPEEVRRLWSRSGLPGDPLDEPLAFVDRDGLAHLSWETASRWAQAFAAAEAEIVGLHLARREEEYLAAGWQPGRRYMHDALRDTKPAYAVMRDWAAQADRDALREEVERLRRLVIQAIHELESAGAKQGARRIKRAYESEA